MQQSGLYAAQEKTDADKVQQAFKDALAREKANDQAIKDIRKQISITKTAISKAEQSIADADITINEARREVAGLDIEIENLEQDLAIKALDGFISSSLTPQEADLSDLSISKNLAYQRSEFFFEKLTDTEADAVEQYRIARQNRAVALGNELNGEQIKAKNEQELITLQQQEKERNAEAKEIEAILDGLIEEIKVLDEVEQEIQSIIKERATQEAIDDGALSWPVDTPYITSPYGYRTHPVTGQRGKLHRGMDLRARTGASIYAAADGKVIAANYAGRAGNLVIIDHGSGKTTYYMHLSAYNTKVGATIKRGDLVGKAGATGSVTAAHLHFEVRINGVAEDPRNHIIGAQ